MSMKKWLIGAGLGVLGFTGLAVSQVITLPQVATLNPFADLIQVLPNGSPVAGNQYATPALITNVYGYYKSPTTIANGFKYLFGTNVTYAQFGNASAISSGYVYLASNPSDGARNCMFSIGGLTAVIVYPGTTSQTINNAITALAANTGVCYLYSASNTTWDRD